MTTHAKQVPAEHRAGDLPTPAPGLRASRSIRQASVIAGIGLLLLSALAGFGNFVVLEGLVTEGDATRTAEDIMASEGMFRVGVASLYLVIVLDVVVAWALFRVFSTVSREISLLGAWFRLVYAGVFMVAISQLAGIPDLLEGDGSSDASDAGQLQVQAMQRIDAFNDIWFAGLVLFGIHLVIIGYLAYKSGFVPRLLGVLLVIAGVGYAFDSFARVLSAGPSFPISTFTFVGEFLLAIWLLVRGRRISSGTDSHGV